MILFFVHLEQYIRDLSDHLEVLLSELLSITRPTSTTSLTFDGTIAENRDADEADEALHPVLYPAPAGDVWKFCKPEETYVAR